jgi:predicted DNA-binding transcriptional regulator AlpA
MKSVPNNVTVPDLAELLGSATETIRRWRKDGMPFKKSGKSLMFDLSEVQAWLIKTKRFKYVPLLKKALGDEDEPLPTPEEIADAVIGDVDGFYQRVHKMELLYYSRTQDCTPELVDYFSDKYKEWAALRHKIEKDIMEVRAQHGDYYHKSEVEKGYAEVGQILKKTFLSQPSALAERLVGQTSETIYKMINDDVKERLRGLPRV